MATIERVKVWVRPVGGAADAWVAFTVDADGCIEGSTLRAQFGAVTVEAVIEPGLAFTTIDLSEVDFLTATPADGEVVVTNLGDDTFSYTVSGSSITAFNGTYTQDVQGRTLTGALLESERVLWLVNPVIAITNDVASNGLADAGDTLGKTHMGLAIYDADQGVPATPIAQWKRDGSDISGETDPVALLLGVPDFGVDITLAVTFGGQTATSAAITVETGSAMELDAGALVWYEPNNVTINTGEVETWPDNTGNGHDLATITAALRPTWNAVSKRVEFRSSAVTALRTAANGPINNVIDVEAGEIAVFMVVEDVGTVANQTIFAENATESGSSATSYGIHTDPDYDFYFCSRTGTNAFGSITLQSTSDAPKPTSGKNLIRYTITQTAATIHVNGVLKYSATPVTSRFAFPAKLSMGARINDAGSANETPANCNVSELFSTSNLSNVGFIETELTTKHGPFAS